MDIQSILQQYGMYIGIGIVFIIGYIVFWVIHSKNMKKTSQNFLIQHPDAAKVFLTVKAMITSEVVNIFEVNGQPPVKFYEGTKTGFYLLPGESVLTLDYTYTRPGVMYKSVSKSTGAVKITVVAEAGKSYYISFDRKEERFIFAEL